MATIKEKLLLEKDKPKNVIVLHREGIFYIAYEHSAWLFSEVIHRFAVKKRFVKNVATEVVSIGFPMSSLDKLVAGRPVVADADCARVELARNECPCDTGFDEWKNAQPVSANKDIACDNSAVEQGKNDVANDILARLRAFPVESRTPVECLHFIIELKRLL